MGIHVKPSMWFEILVASGWFLRDLLHWIDTHTKRITCPSKQEKQPRGTGIETGELFSGLSLVVQASHSARDRVEERFEQEKRENADLHNERVIRLTASGYNVRESVEALAAMKRAGR